MTTIIKTEKTVTEPKTKAFQFIAAASGSGVLGKNDMTKSNEMKRTERMLIGSPAAPGENREGRKGSFLRRFSVTQEIETMYDDSSAPTPRDVIMLKATVDPMLMRESKTAIT